MEVEDAVPWAAAESGSARPHLGLAHPALTAVGHRFLQALLFWLGASEFLPPPTQLFESPSQPFSIEKEHDF